MIRGKVIRSTGSWFKVETETQGSFDCRIKGKFRLQDKILTNPVAVGDVVTFEIENELERSGLILEIGPRQNYIVRQSPRNAHQLHLLAANVDQVVLMVTIVEPNLKQGFIDRFLLMTEPHNLPVTILFNKCDIYSPDDLLLYEYLQAVYEAIGYRVILTSTTGNTGIEELRGLLDDKVTMISGQSGVGKSSLINKLAPHLTLRTTSLSDKSGKGQHTTTFAQMYELASGAYIIDTPGIKNLGFNNLTPQDVAHNFREFFILSADCRFSNCMHRDEPHCAVKDALEKEEISSLRYNNYITILEEVESQNLWELPKKY